MDTDEVSHPPAYARLEVASLPGANDPPPTSQQHHHQQQQQQQPEPVQQFTIVTPDKSIQHHLHNYLGLAITTSIFGNIIIGVCAVGCSVQSIRSARAGDIDKARLYASISLRLSITALILGIISILVGFYLAIF